MESKYLLRLLIVHSSLTHDDLHKKEDNSEAEHADQATLLAAVSASSSPASTTIS